MMTTNLFVITNVKQLRTDGSFRILLPFIRTSWGVGVLNSAMFNSFHNRVEFGTILEGLRNFRGGEGLTPPKPSPWYATARSTTTQHTWFFTWWKPQITAFFLLRIHYWCLLDFIFPILSCWIVIQFPLKNDKTELPFQLYSLRTATLHYSICKALGTETTDK